MNMQYEFDISGLKIKVHTDISVAISEAFKPFILQNVKKADVDIFFDSMSTLKKPQGQCVYEEFFFKIYKKENKFYMCFYDLKEEMKLYAIAKFISDSEIKVNYLKQYACNISSIRSCFMHIAFEELLMRHKRFMLHASFIQTKYGGLVFSGPSGIGKSTQADLWKKYKNAEIINGDRTILKQQDSYWIGFGSPYAGSSQYFVNKSCKIVAIIFLEKGRENKLEKIPMIDSFKKIYSQMLINVWDLKYIEVLSEGIEKMVKNIAVYKYTCTPDKDSVEYLDKFLDKEICCGGRTD